MTIVQLPLDKISVQTCIKDQKKKKSHLQESFAKDKIYNLILACRLNIFFKIEIGGFKLFIGPNVLACGTIVAAILICKWNNIFK